MAERLTIRHGNRTDCNTLCMEDCDHCWHLGIIREKLARFEDLEEQGRLIELPCAVGDTIYYLLGIPNKTPCEIEETKFYLSDLNRIGKDLFLTKAEAEAALKGAEE